MGGARESGRVFELGVGAQDVDGCALRRGVVAGVPQARTPAQFAWGPRLPAWKLRRTLLDKVCDHFLKIFAV